MLRTSLYELVWSVSEELPVEDDRRVAVIVSDILRRSSGTYANKKRPRFTGETMTHGGCAFI